MKIRKILAAITSIALVGTMLAGCGDSSNSSGSGTISDNSGAGDNSGTGEVVNDETDVKLTVWGPQEEQDMLKAMCQAFADANPELNCEFTYEVVSEADAATTLINDLDKGADVFSFSLDQFGTMIAAGVLNPVINQTGVKSVVPEATAAALSKDGILYAYPWVSENLVLFYDKSMFTEEEVKSIDTMMAKDLSEFGDNVKNFIYDLDNGWYNAAFFLGAGCTLFGEDGTDASNCTFNNETGVLVGNYLYDLANNSKFQGATAGTADDSVVLEAFRSRTVGATVSGPWNCGAIMEALEDDFGVTVLPTYKLGDEDVQLSHFINIKSVAVKSNTAFPKTAHALAEWLTNAENSFTKGTINGASYNPVRTDVDTSGVDNPALAVAIESSKNGTPARTISQMNNFWTPAEAFGQGLASGDVTKDNMQDKLNTFVDSILTNI